MNPAPRHATARRTVIGTLAVVLATGIGLAACGDDDGDVNNDSPTTTVEMMDDSPTTTVEMMDDMTPSTEMMDGTMP